MLASVNMHRSQASQTDRRRRPTVACHHIDFIQHSGNGRVRQIDRHTSADTADDEISGPIGMCCAMVERRDEPGSNLEYL
jgi:hypothetical protein